MLFYWVVLPGASNLIADRESQTLHTSTEWMLHPVVCHQIFQSRAMQHRTVCKSIEQLVESAYPLETRHLCHSNRCIPEFLGRVPKICIPSMCTSRKMPSENTARGQCHDITVPSVASSTLVPGVDKMPDRVPDSAAVGPGPPKGSIQLETKHCPRHCPFQWVIHSWNLFPLYYIDT